MVKGFFLGVGGGRWYGDLQQFTSTNKNVGAVGDALTKIDIE